uniref:2Fe-2S ferredoxin-type domain-containing protein n=1 Tax=Entomoneis paludosa TaxID=265537 RepID=A0A7S2Y988_9STRA|eukprot:CAMPEP_0172471856 /NCGR_PEP_ID=MMETSP1065-20121228/68035_1 /TAXON_ID=265537 /ORGANISM="Amphiprora paludosa, Strain CCMP125" /LENGTH=186 /DNA_ID=CAMNT_0013229971 /DNA_START=34 /DNA_END=594 /DNA_ORIENTATION=-
MATTATRWMCGSATTAATWTTNLATRTIHRPPPSEALAAVLTRRSLSTCQSRQRVGSSSSCVSAARHARLLFSTDATASTETVPITFVNPDNTEVTVQATIGQHLLDVAHANNIELEGACGGELACSTCHLIFPEEVMDQLPEKTEEEEDMLDLAFEVQPTSRLGCQIPVRKEYAGLKLKIPDDGF